MIELLSKLSVQTGADGVCCTAALIQTTCALVSDGCPAVAQYEPELFPGLIYRMKVPKVVLLIFVSGKVVLTGESPAVPSRRLTGAFNAAAM